jgi:hypothetical protein
MSFLIKYFYNKILNPDLCRPDDAVLRNRSVFAPKTSFVTTLLVLFGRLLSQFGFLHFHLNNFSIQSNAALTLFCETFVCNNDNDDNNNNNNINNNTRIYVYV